ncbi:MAG: PQQ-binding-like beta-propeller repeat protein, partial [Synechococcaceae cyanobacterium]|nr:PQQ-binding-like beta-propeller repeat protein [Synechococcaceae cyanobacterium]
MSESARPALLLAVAGILLAAASCAPRSADGTPPDAGGAEAVPAPVAGTMAWPGWGGPEGDFQVPDAGLGRSWPEGGPPALWSRELGPGYSGVTVADGLLVTMYRDGGEEVTVALDAASGEPVWQRRDQAPTLESHVVQFGEGPNATPLRAGDTVVTLGYTGLLRALAAATGDLRWSHDLLAEFDGEVLDFGTSASPVLWQGRVIVLVGGARQA